MSGNLKILHQNKIFNHIDKLAFPKNGNANFILNFAFKIFTCPFVALRRLCNFHINIRHMSLYF